MSKRVQFRTSGDTMLALAAESQRTPSPVFDQTAYIRPQRLVAIGGGRRLNLYCSGSGKPVVILEAGAGGSMLGLVHELDPQLK